jgi:hypothetical protein
MFSLFDEIPLSFFFQRILSLVHWGGEGVGGIWFGVGGQAGSGKGTGTETQKRNEVGFSDVSGNVYLIIGSCR